jgi:NTP pyrophosphatase (non-canonical NTP hydrolase)
MENGDTNGGQGMNLEEFVKIYEVKNLRHSKCTNPHHDEYGHLCEELIELKAACNSNDKVSIAEELADVVIMVAIYANKLNIDLAWALEMKTVQNFRNHRLAQLDTKNFTHPVLPDFDAHLKQKKGEGGESKQNV